MTLYMDIHGKAQGVTTEAVADAHSLDLATQEKYGVRYLTYWFNEDAGKIFCLCEAPSMQAAEDVHREAHGMVADQLIEVQQQMVDALLAPARENHGAQLDPESNSKLDTAFRTVLYTDMEDSTAITQRIGDAGMMALLRAHDAVIRHSLQQHGGREVKHTGDGFMVSFTSVASAVECAIAIQRDIAAYGRAHPDQAVRVRIGISAGEPVEDSDDLFGATVQLAARACSHAEAGQIVVSNVVRELCIGKVIAFEDPESMSGHLLPRFFLLKRGFKLVETNRPAADSSPPEIGFVFAYTQAKLVELVLTQQVAAGAFNDDDYAKLDEKRRSDINILAETELLPRHLVSIRKDMTPALASRIENILVSMNEDAEGRRILQKTGDTTKNN